MVSQETDSMWMVSQNDKWQCSEWRVILWDRHWHYSDGESEEWHLQHSEWLMYESEELNDQKHFEQKKISLAQELYLKAESSISVPDKSNCLSLVNEGSRLEIVMSSATVTSDMSSTIRLWLHCQEEKINRRKYALHKSLTYFVCNIICLYCNHVNFLK